MESIIANEHLKNETGKDRYGDDKPLDHDRVINGQIMVTITLDEYRSLIRGSADAQISAANSEKFRVNQENTKLKQQVETLQKQLDELRSMIASAMPKKEEADA